MQSVDFQSPFIVLHNTRRTYSIPVLSRAVSERHFQYLALGRDLTIYGAYRGAMLSIRQPVSETIVFSVGMIFLTRIIRPRLRILDDYYTGLFNIFENLFGLK